MLLSPGHPVRARLPLALLACLLLAGAGGCREDALPADPGVVRGTGTVRHLEIEGGFYGIVADDGTRLDPVNLEPALAVDGLRIRFVARVLHDRVSTHQWGTLVELLRAGRS